MLLYWKNAADYFRGLTEELPIWNLYSISIENK